MGCGVALTGADAYRQKVLEAKPAVYFRFNEAGQLMSESGGLKGELMGGASIKPTGPKGRYYPDFPEKNSALQLRGGGQYVRIKDPGDRSVLDFKNGDSITMEAWVNPETLGNYSYIIGKGRTLNPGVPANNQNYSLRLAALKGNAGITFLFRSANNKLDQDWHRWTSDTGFDLGGWHHVAVSYTFGKPNSLRGYIDGEPVKGKWDMGGQTTAEPWVDNDEVWIGATLGGQQASTLQGGIDEVAIHRQIISAETMEGRYRFAAPRFIDEPKQAPTENVRIDLHEGVKEGWNLVANDPVSSFTEPLFAIPNVPRKYNDKGLIMDHPDVFLLRAQSRVKLPKGPIKLLLRSRTTSRLKIDGKVVATISSASKQTSAHGAVSKAPVELDAVTRLLRPGMQERVVEFISPGGEQHILLEAFVGGAGKRRPETGELSVAYSVAGKPFELLGGKSTLVLTDANWRRYVIESGERMLALNQSNRNEKGRAEANNWAARHAIMAAENSKRIAAKVPDPVKGYPANNEIDHFINDRLADSGHQKLPLVSDEVFARRVSLDVNGVVPAPELIRDFLADAEGTRRSVLIDRLLSNHLAWADHWTSYWQDVLAENPNILKPKLNNTGPFRFWIHEALLDNKPMDRFVTELVMMEGSQYYGGPAGFGVATQNDVPMAAKAQVLGQAFLGKQMKCARCHDAPFHSFNQKDLFGMAAMLQRGPLKVPSSSSVPIIPGRRSRVEVTLKPGTAVPPFWAFKQQELSEPIMRDSRSQLAALITGEHAERFSQVIVNRVWKRYFGWGLVESVDDWEGVEPSHPELLRWLAHQFIASGYDLKQVARLILNSHAYQRQVDPGFVQAGKPAERLFAGPARRRMTAEQLLDSLFVVAGKNYRVEPLTLDINGRGAVTTFLNLGQPRRAWEFTSLSNERDRPALSIPKAQSVVDVLQTFGWRDARQDAVTERDHEVSALQPALLANGVVGRRITQLSEDSAFTELALREIDCKALIGELYLRILGRAPTPRELGIMLDHVNAGFSHRVIKGAKPVHHREQVLDVSWNNHLSEDANRIKVELERAVLAGDPPTQRLRPEWREDFEDVIYALINSPEFIFIP